MRDLRTIKKEDFYNTINSLGLTEILKCKCCGKVIDYTNFGFISRNFYACEKRNCMKVVLAEMMLYDYEKKGGKTKI